MTPLPSAATRLPAAPTSDTAYLPAAPTSDTGYLPGICNIGPAEITRRRRAGHAALGLAVVLYIGLVAIEAPPIVRLLVALPAAAAASGYLQARFRFCAGFASRGVFNFGPLGQTQHVDDAEARGRDHARATRIGLASLAIGVAAGVVAAVLPL